MTLEESQACASETLSYFIRVMPGAEAAVGGTVIEFAQKGMMAEKYMELLAKYTPERIINGSQKQDLEDNVYANALIGRETSAVAVRFDPAMPEAGMRRVMFHEFMHIYCAKVEADGEHFIDVYGTGTTRETGLFDAEYDGCLASGYKVWSEFIADYYAVKHTEKRVFAFQEARTGIESVLSEVINGSLTASKGAFAFACSYLFNCTDIDRVIEELAGPGYIWDDGAPYGTAARGAFFACAGHIQAQLRADRPWKISEGYISGLGMKFLMFRTANSLYLAG